MTVVEFKVFVFKWTSSRIFLMSCKTLVFKSNIWSLKPTQSSCDWFYYLNVKEQYRLALLSSVEKAEIGRALQISQLSGVANTPKVGYFPLCLVSSMNQGPWEAQEVSFISILSHFLLKCNFSILIILLKGYSIKLCSVYETP